jgi:TolB-like protein/Tfp pilus assembly protein PilF
LEITLATSFFTELKRRNVFKVGGAYLVLAWFLIQVTVAAVPAFGMPEWVDTVVFFFCILGFPFALFFAWAFEVTPEGIKKESDISSDESIAVHTGRKFNFVIIGLLVLIAGYFVYESRFASEGEQNLVVESLSTEIDSVKEIATEPEGSSIAVLPFVNMSSDKEQEYFSDGITEEILNVLAKLPKLHVTSRSSSFFYKGKDIKISQVAEELGVNNILEGSVRRSGNKIRITAQLIEAKTDKHLWSQTYDRELKDIFAVQDEIAQAIVVVLKDILQIDTLINTTLTSTTLTANLEAYDLFLKGRHAFYQREGYLDSAIELLQQAVELDPQFSEAWAFLAASASIALIYTTDISDEDANALANDAVAIALELRPDSSLVNTVLGRQSALRYQWQQSINYLTKAIELDTTNSTAHTWLGYQYHKLGYIQRATEHYEKAVLLEPQVGVSQNNLSAIYMADGKYQAGYKHAIEALELDFDGAFFTLLPVIIQGHLAKDMYQLNDKYMLDSVSYPQNEASLLFLKLFKTLKPGQENSALLTSYEQQYPGLFSIHIYLWFGYVHEYFELIDIELGQQNIDVTLLDVMRGILWLPQNKIILEDPRTIKLFEQAGIVDYWKAAGFPDGCRYIELENPHLECH